MLQRAASNAYSWWWASHVWTKQSKWLEHNLQDMEEKVKYMLEIIEEDGDSFAKRAEMYYRKRPELISFVEDAYRAYRALAERYDHLSRELQNANRTIATVFPEQVELAMDAEGENPPPVASSSISSSPSDDANKPSKVLPAIPKTAIPKIPSLARNYGKTFSRKGQLKRDISSVVAPSSGLTKAQALEEIDKLQKGILALQTEKEFVKCSYESGLAKYWEIEKQITDMQGRVCKLQDEFGIGTVIEDDEARNLMAASALKSCQDSLARLQERQEQSAEDARVEQQKIEAAHGKLKTLKNEDSKSGRGQQDQRAEKHEPMKAESAPESDIWDQHDGSSEQERQSLELMQYKRKVEEEFELESTSSLNITQLAEKIDDLVNNVISLETVLSSQTALVQTLRLETGELQVHIQTLEDDKDALVEGSGSMSNKLRELEEELNRVKKLSKNVEDQNHNLQKHFVEATCNLDHLSEKLKNVKPDEDIENGALFQEVKKQPTDVNGKGSFKEHDQDLLVPGSTGLDILNDFEQGEGEKVLEEEERESRVESDANLQSNLSETSQEVTSSVEGEEPKVLREKQEEDQTNWRQLTSNEFEEREKILLEEYSTILHDYREVKKKLSDLEMKKRDSIFESAMQIRELRQANALKDEEIQTLRWKLKNSHIKSDQSLENSSSLKEFQSQLGLKRQGKSTGTLFHVSDDVHSPSPAGDQHHSLHDLLKQSNIGYTMERKTSTGIEVKLRSEIDSLLEENLEFWLRFSTAFHQLQKFQTSIHDLKCDVFQLNRALVTSKPHHHQRLKSDARAIYKHLREIETELALWLEQNKVLKDELQTRMSSLCSIQEEIERASIEGWKKDADQVTMKLDQYQAAKFQGEVLNMKHENKKVAEELRAGLNRVQRLQVEVDKTLRKMDQDFRLSNHQKHYRQQQQQQQQQHHHHQSVQRSRVPLRSFLFGVKLKKHQKPSIFSCMNPALQKQYSDLASAPPP